MVQIRSYFHEPTSSVTHLVWDPPTREAALVDPVLDYDAASGRTATEFVRRILADIAAEELTLPWVLETHAHADHLSAAAVVKERTGARTVIGAGIRKVQALFKDLFNADLTADGSAFDVFVSDGDRLPLGGLDIEVLETPGHTPACVSYRIGDAVFVGDTLMMPDYGTARADFPGGDARALPLDPQAPTLPAGTAFSSATTTRHPAMTASSGRRRSRRKRRATSTSTTASARPSS